MLSFAAISPHPPIIIPTIGSPDDLERVKKTVRGMEKLREEFEKANPETVLIISPHGPVGVGKMGLTEAQELLGDFSMFGDFSSSFKFENDKEICEEIKKECENQNIPLQLYNKNILDHGTLVPLCYLSKNLKPKIVPLAYSLLDRNAHFLFGKILGKIAKASQKKIGVIASGDLSHRLLPEAPAGYSPRGKEFDAKLIEFLKENNTDEILNMDEELVEEAGECGYRSIIILLGALSNLQQATYKLQLLSYEGLFGVGYLVASFQIKN